MWLILKIVILPFTLLCLALTYTVELLFGDYDSCSYWIQRNEALFNLLPCSWLKQYLSWGVYK